MALRRSSGSILKVGSSRRRSRGSGGSFDIPKARLYDMEYRQMTEDYRDDIISFDEYIAFLENKREGIGDEDDHFTISKRIKDVTNAYNKKAESDWKAEAKLEEQKYAEDYKNGLIGFEAFYPYLQEKAEYFCGQDSDSSECFMATKKAEDVMFQQNDREMDFMFKALKTVSPDNYISWKESQLDGLDPNSNAYMQIYKDIESAKKEKVSRGKTDLEYDILIGEANKADLLKWLDDAIKNTDDPDMQKKYFTQRCNLADSMNKEIEAEWNRERALEDKEAALKFRRGDYGNTDAENREGYYNYLMGQYESEYDPSKQMTYIGKMDTLIKQEEDAAEGRYKKGLAAGKANDKAMADDFRATVKETNAEIKKIERDMDRGIITSEDFAHGMWEIIKGKEGLEADIFALEAQGVGENTFDLLVKELEATRHRQETEGFWKAFIPTIIDGEWTGELEPNPNWKTIQKFDSNGNYKVSFLHDPDQSHELEGYIYDKDAKLHRKYDIVDMKDKDGNVIKVKGKAVKTKEIYMIDSEGNTTKISLDEKTQEWMNERTGQAQGNFMMADTSRMKPEELEKHIQKISREKGMAVLKTEWQKIKEEEGLGKTVLVKYMQENPDGFLAKWQETSSDVAGKIGEGVGWMAEKGPKERLGEMMGEAKETIFRSGSEITDAMNIDRTNLMNAGKDFLSGAKGEAVKVYQQGLVAAGILDKRFANGIVGPATEKAKVKLADKVKTQITADFSEDTLGRLPSDAGKIWKGITSAAQSYAQTAYAQNKIGGQLGDVYAKRKDLQQHFDASGKGISAAWKGHNIWEWAERHGKAEEASLRGGTFKPPTQQKPSQFKFKMPTSVNLKQTSRDFTKPWKDFGKDLFSPIQQASQKAQSRISSDFSKEKRKRLKSDVGVIGRYTSKKVGGWLSKLKWWK